MFGKNKKKNSDNTITDAVNSSPEAIEREAGKLGALLIQTLDKTMSWQSTPIIAYVKKLHTMKPEHTPEQVQKRIDRHFLNIVTGSGGSAGGAAVLPGVGFFTGMAAVAGESVFFLEAAAWHTLASATLRGIDITDPERRRTLILAALNGSEGTALVASLLGNDSVRNRAKTNSASAISRLGASQLGMANKMLLRAAKKRFMKNARLAAIGKLMPLGIGAVIGATANRKLGNVLLERTRASLGPIPRSWAEFDDKALAAGVTGEKTPAEQLAAATD